MCCITNPILFIYKCNDSFHMIIVSSGMRTKVNLGLLNIVSLVLWTITDSDWKEREW